MQRKVSLTALAGAAMLLGAGSTWAAPTQESAADCLSASIRRQAALDKIGFDLTSKFCQKGAEAEVAASLGEKYDKKLNKAFEKYAKAHAKLNCTTDQDPSKNVPAPPPPVPAGTGEAFLMGEAVACDGL